MSDSVLGREKELERIVRFLDAVTTGPAACVLEGKAGIGKTALWRHAVTSARQASFCVLFSTPAEVEVAFSYSSLADLLARVEPGALDALPTPQREALEVALLRAGPGDAVARPHAVAMAVVTLLDHLASVAPVVVAIDDAQWLDRPSARVLEFAARRLERRPVGFLLSVRTPADNAALLGLDRLPGDVPLERISIRALSAGALHQVIKGRFGATFNRAALLRIHRATGGNPFFALELAASLLQAGLPPAGQALPVPDDIRDVITRSLTALPEATREMLLFAAAAPNPTVDSLSAALQASPEHVLDHLVGADAAGVIAVEGESVRFRHPLFSSAIYGAATGEQRRQAHRRLAELAMTTEQRARHLALSIDEADGTIARTVADAAREVRMRGAPDAAADLVELAIRLTPASAADEYDQRALDLGYFLVEAGDPDKARDVVLAVAVRPGRLQARALLDLAGLDYWGDGSRPAIARCEQALKAASGDTALEAACHAELAIYCDFDASRSERHAEAALRLLDAAGVEADPDARIDALLAATRAGLLLGRGLSFDAVEQAYESESRALASIHRSRVGAQLGQWLKYVDDFDGSRAKLEEAVSQAIQEGDESSIPNQLMHLAQVECWSGNWPLALRYAEESFELAEQVGQSFGGPPAIRALVDAHLGDVERARTTVEERLDAAADQPLAVPLYLRVLGFLQLSLGDAPGAARHLSRAVELAEGFGIREPAVFRVHADLIEALIGTGELDRAEEVLGVLESRGRLSPVPWSLATGRRCRGLLLAARGELEAAELAFEDALREHEHSPVPFERGRTLLALGLLQRRRNERRLGQESLAQALAIFEELGAPLWAGRAKREMRPVGGRPTSRDTLTAAEQHVAELAASGLTNREVAAALSISPKTVEAALSRTYRKLEIHSRAELGARIAVTRPRDLASAPDPLVQQ